MHLPIKKAAAIAFAALFCGCAASENTAGTAAETSTETVLSADNADNIISAAALNSVDTDTDPFTGYSAEIKGAEENYVITVKQGEYPDEIAVSVENNRYETRDFVCLLYTSPSPRDRG